MELIKLLDILLRWIHVMSVIVLLGGSFFLRFVLMPAAKVLPDVEQGALQQRLGIRWKRLVTMMVALIFLTGLYNFFARIRSVKLEPTYHMLFGLKFLLAMIVFTIASALVGRSKAFERVREHAGLWITINLAIAATIIFISGILKSYQGTPKPVSPTTSIAAPAEVYRL